VGKWAYFIILSQELLQVEEDDSLNTKVLRSFVGGKEVYNAADKV
jgi:predicted amidohydrolase YtcJ